ncbi:hypothetical protein ABTZ94_37260, partial [Streptomyces sp. NPDC002785]
SSDRGEGAGMSDLERITARRSELEALAEELGKRLQEVEAEREELVSLRRVCTVSLLYRPPWREKTSRPVGSAAWAG